MSIEDDARLEYEDAYVETTASVEVCITRKGVSKPRGETKGAVKTIVKV